MATSAVPAAIDALLTIFRAAPGLAGVTIIDGPPVQDMSGRDFLAVGWSLANEASTAAEASQDFANAGARNRNEDFAITGWLESWTGDKDIAPRRTRAYELLAAVEDALRATDAQPEAPTLLGTVLWAHLTSHSLHQSPADGVRAGIAFTITCRVRI
ncbi:hypothetical protein ABZ498_06605 [Streptomyces lavendulocolor]|uniref:hypothetical protein n=1 Tax=Streptomyces lavendulocolor TaxID=67316 RepID=UPI0033E80F55